jgi:hypothetical protein
MKRFAGINGRRYSDDQRKAMFYRMNNRFSPAILAAAAPAVAGAVVDVGKKTVQMPGKIVSGGFGLGMHELQQAQQTALAAANPGLQAGGAVLGDFVANIDELGGPPTPTVPELLANSYLDEKGKPIPVDGITEMVNGVPIIDENAMFSYDNAYDIDVDKMRKVVQKEYPGADVDTKVVLLPPDKYMSRALKDNPGREDEAVISNGFYNPTSDKTYLEAGDKLNTTRALIHELVHDMADDGVKEDYMLNEGYGDYVAFKIMTDELGVPKGVALKTIGYPKEMKQVEKLVNKYGRKRVDEAFLKYHTLGSLKEVD